MADHPAAGLIRAMKIVVDYLDLQMTTDRASNEMADTSNFLTDEIDKLIRMEPTNG